MFPVTSTKHVQLTTNFCSIELQLSNENSTTIKPETNSCGDTNKEDKTTDFSALGNEIAGVSNSNKDCHQGNKTVKEDHSVFNANLCEINILGSPGCNVKNTDAKLGDVNYTEEKNGARSKTNQSEKYLSNQQYISGEEEYRFDHRTHFKETDSLGNIKSEQDHLKCEHFRKYGFKDEEADNGEIDEVQNNNLSTSIKEEQVLQDLTVEMKGLAKDQRNTENLTSTNDNNKSKRGDNSSHNDHGYLLPGGPVDSSPELLKQMKPIKSPNYVKRQSTSYGDIVKRFSFPLSQPLERSLSEDIPVIVRRRGCTLRVRIASITEGDLERLREVC